MHFPPQLARRLHRPSRARRESERPGGDGRAARLGTARADAAAGRREPGWRNLPRVCRAGARAHDVALVGGDTTPGPLSVTVQILGHRAARRRRCCARGAQPGDALFVSGTPGDAAAGLALEQGRLTAPADAARLSCASAFSFPTPARGARRVPARLCERLHRRVRRPARRCRQAGARERLWRRSSSSRRCRSPRRCVAAVGEERARELALTGGDDYELCFTVPAAARRAAARGAAAGALGLHAHRRRCARPRAPWSCARVRDGVLAFGLSIISLIASAGCPARRTGPARATAGRVRVSITVSAVGARPYPVAPFRYTSRPCQHRLQIRSAPQARRPYPGEDRQVRGHQGGRPRQHRGRVPVARRVLRPRRRDQGLQHRHRRRRGARPHRPQDVPLRGAPGRACCSIRTSCRSTTRARKTATATS